MINNNVIRHVLQALRINLYYSFNDIGYFPILATDRRFNKSICDNINPLKKKKKLYLSSIIQILKHLCN